MCGPFKEKCFLWFSFGHKLHVYDESGNEVAFIQQKVMSFLPKFFIYINGQEVTQIVKEFTFLKPSYRVDGMGWSLSGNFFQHDYILSSAEKTVMRVSKEWFTWGDSYSLDIADVEDALLCLCVVLAVDCVLEAERNRLTS